MNIFFLDWDVRKCAQEHLDKHCVKMILEYAQILCSVHHMTEQVTEQVPYKLAHKNHPCCVWARNSMSNYLYLCELGDRKSTRLNSSHIPLSRMPSSA